MTGDVYHRGPSPPPSRYESLTCLSAKMKEYPVYPYDKASLSTTVITDDTAQITPVTLPMDEHPRTRVRVYMAPEPITIIHGRSVFLAGSIIGDWHATLTQRLAADLTGVPFTIFNPRRNDWDDTWVSRRSDPRFYEQTTWELDQQDRADIIAIYLHPDTKAPISLLELGLSAHAGKAVVCCPEGFHYKGNVEIVCDRLGIEMVDTFDELVGKLKGRLQT